MTGKRLARVLRALTYVSLLAALPVQAAAWLMASTEPRVVPGQRFEVIVIGLAGGAELPDRLQAEVEPTGGGLRIALDLVAVAAADARMQHRRYAGLWPMEVEGVATLFLREAPSARLLLDGGAALRTPVQAAQAGGVDAAAPVTARAWTEPVAPSAIGFHEPMFFLVGGSDPVSARFQFSFRYRIFDDLGVLAETLPVARGLYFGFTQTSLWDLQSDSKPFRDSSFRPSLFYRWMLSDPQDRGSLALSGGYEHESNGREGEVSRSIDTLFLRAELRYMLPDGRTYVGVAPKWWSYLDKSDNPDIARFRGYGELGLRLGRDDGLMLSSLVRRGTAGKIGTQLDLSYPLRRSVFSGVGAFAHLQYFRGYGETLLDYDERQGSQFRIGVSLVR